MLGHGGVHDVGDRRHAPNVLLHHVKHNKVLHERNLLRHRASTTRCRGSSTASARVEALGHDCWQVTLNFGFKNEPDVPDALARLRAHGC